MKKFQIMITLCLIAIAGQAQFIQGSVKKDSDPNKINIVFKPDFNSVAGEYVNFLQFSLAVPIASAKGVTASAVGVNSFSNMGTLAQGVQYTQGTERIFTWVFANPTPPITPLQPWTKGVEFTGVVVRFSTPNATAVGKMVDFTHNDGGGNYNTYFAIVTNTGDKSNYSNLFYATSDTNHLGNYKNGDQFVKTGAK